jgi:pimeloyl-ACP methyl ester carboxylesterase
MSRFVLVHGSWHGAWCWDKVVPLLEAAGHRAVAIDLPGHGADRTAFAEVSLDGYARCIQAALDAEPEPPILVGHSMGGGAITQAAELAPERIAALVYVAAFIPRPGESVAELAQSDAGSLIGRHVVVDPVSGTAHLDDAVVRECFYGDCTASDLARARSRLRPDPLAPLITPLRAGRRGGPGDATAIRSVYIECLKDRAVTPALQRRLHTRARCERVYTLETSHSPFFSAPEALARLLIASIDARADRR